MAVCPKPHFLNSDRFETLPYRHGDAERKMIWLLESRGWTCASWVGEKLAFHPVMVMYHCIRNTRSCYLTPRASYRVLFFPAPSTSAADCFIGSPSVMQNLFNFVKYIDVKNDIEIFGDYKNVLYIECIDSWQIYHK